MPYRWDFANTIGAAYNTVLTRPMSDDDPSFFEADPIYKKWVIDEFQRLVEHKSRFSVFEILVGAIERQREGDYDKDVNDYYVRECVATLAKLHDLDIGEVLVKADEHHRRMTYVSFPAQDFLDDNWHLFIPFGDTVSEITDS
jgi:hypothetical protein